MQALQTLILEIEMSKALREVGIVTGSVWLKGHE